AAVAFTVNVEWVRREYFAPLLQQVARIGGNEAALSLTGADETGRIVASSGAYSRSRRLLKRPFALAFLDAALLPDASAQRLAPRAWRLNLGLAPPGRPGAGGDA